MEKVQRRLQQNKIHQNTLFFFFWQLTKPLLLHCKHVTASPFPAWRLSDTSRGKPRSTALEKAAAGWVRAGTREESIAVTAISKRSTLPFTSTAAGKPPHCPSSLRKNKGILCHNTGIFGKVWIIKFCTKTWVFPTFSLTAASDSTANILCFRLLSDGLGPRGRPRVT